MEPCQTCNGQGYTAHGTGQNSSPLCLTCNGQGEVPSEFYGR